MTDVLMPALSPTMEEGTLAKWHVKVGDAVRSGDVIAEIETDKATMEVEAVDEGVVEALLVPEGTEEVKVNTPIARLKGEGEPSVARMQPPSPPAGPARQGSQAPEKAPPPRDAFDPRAPAVRPALSPPTSADGGRERRIFASPLARRLASEAGVDLATLTGSGPHGRIIARDLTREARAPDAPRPAVSPAPAPPRAGASPQPSVAPSLEQLGIAPGSYDLVPLDGMRKTVARRLTEAFRDIPHFPLTIDIEIDALVAARTRINAMLEADGVKVSVNDMLIKAAATALRRRPHANASFTREGIALHHHADISMAVAIPGGGLITPIVRAAETKGLAEIARETKDLAERARARKLKPEEYLGGTFSISNLGMFGVTSFASILNPPQGAILSVGAAAKRAVVRGDAVAVATMLTVTLTCDHRVIDGAIGAAWLAAFKGLVEEPLAMIV